MTLKFNGNTRLEGSVTSLGSAYSSLSILAASLLFNEVNLDNIPNVSKTNEFLASLAGLGVISTWSTKNDLHVEALTITAPEVFKSLLISPLLIRLGEVLVQKTELPPELIQLFKDFGLDFNPEADLVLLRLPKIDQVTVNLESSLSASIAALILSTAAAGVVTLNNFLFTEETLDLIDFLRAGGFEITAVPLSYGELKIVPAAARPLAVTFSLPASGLESAFWASSAVMSYGDITIKNVSKERLISFLSKLAALGVHFEFNDRQLRVWHDETHPLAPLNIELTKNAPLYDYLPLLIPLMLRAAGLSHISGITVSDEPYIKDLNLFDAKITNNTIGGPASLKGVKIALPDFTTGLVLILAALGSSGRSELLESERACDFFDNLPKKLEQLLKTT